MAINFSRINSIKDKVSKDINRQLEIEDQQQQSVALINRYTSDTEEQLLIYNTLWGAGFLQEYLDDEYVENILINKYDSIYIEYTNKERVKIEQIFHSDEQLRQYINILAHRGKSNESLSISSPSLPAVLPDGSRIQALMSITPHVQVAIRKHGMKKMTLNDLCDLNMFSSDVLRFLIALVKCRYNVMIAGIPGAGKTTLLRSMALEIPEDERVATLETEYELYLHQLREHIIPMQEQRTDSKIDISGKPIDQMTLSTFIPLALRMNVSRLIVGEVRSVEVVPMLEAMTAGASGSMCTVHALNPYVVIRRLTKLIKDVFPTCSDESAIGQIGDAVDFIIYVTLDDQTRFGGNKKRYISHIVELIPEGDGSKIVRSDIYKDGRFYTRPSMGILNQIERFDKGITNIFNK